MVVERLRKGFKMFSIEYKGTQGMVTGETIVDGLHFVIWHAVLVTGETISAPMFHFVCPVESVLEQLQAKPLSTWSDIE
jgi:hypothetical protein